MTRQLIAILALSVVGALVSGGAYAQGEAAAPIAAKAPPLAKDQANKMTVATTNVADLKSVFATVESLNVVAARARIGGVVAQLAIDEGDRIEAGQLLAVIGDEKLGLQISGLGSQVRALEAARANALIELDRAKKLFASGFVAKTRLDSAQTAYDVADNQLKAARAQRSVVGAQEREGDIVAPTAGVVLAVPVVEGSVITPGETIAQIATEDYVLRLSLPERHARYLKEGDRVIVDAVSLGAADETANGEKPRREGRITRVYPKIQNGRVLADAAVDGLGDFFVGERVRVLVGTEERQAYLIPERFVSTRFGIDFVRIETGGDKAYNVVVQRGRETLAPNGEEGVEILSGISEGDVLLAP